MEHCSCGSWVNSFKYGQKKAIQHHELPEWSPTPVLNGPVKLNFAIRNGMRCELDGMAVSITEQHGLNHKCFVVHQSFCKNITFHLITWDGQNIQRLTTGIRRSLWCIQTSVKGFSAREWCMHIVWVRFALTLSSFSVNAQQCNTLVPKLMHRWIQIPHIYHCANFGRNWFSRSCKRRDSIWLGFSGDIYFLLYLLNHCLNLQSIFCIIFIVPLSTWVQICDENAWGVQK